MTSDLFDRTAAEFATLIDAQVARNAYTRGALFCRPSGKQDHSEVRFSITGVGQEGWRDSLQKRDIVCVQWIPPRA